MKTKTLLRKTDKPGNHRFAKKHIIRCECGHIFGANSCDVHERLCPLPECEGGASAPTTWSNRRGKDIDPVSTGRHRPSRWWGGGDADSAHVV